MHIKSESDLQKLLNELTKKRPSGPAYAAFDADGTLWDMDMGENFFDYIVKNNLVPLPESPWEHYFTLQDRVSKEVAYLWLAQIFKGVPLEQVRQWAQESVEAISSVPVFDFQKKIIAHLLDLEVNVYIVTASIKWAVEPAANLVGLSPAQVVGIETVLENGKIGMKQKGLLTYREGKAKRIQEITGGIAPYFCSGNTEGDFELLKAASDLRFVVANTASDHPNHTTERFMVETAKKEGWFYHCPE